LSFDQRRTIYECVNLVIPFFIPVTLTHIWRWTGQGQ